MPSTLIRLAVALLTFGVGVSATMFWIAYRTPDVKRLETTPRHAHPQPPLPLSILFVEGKAISKPAPVYPPLAKAYLVSGAVQVQITVDENGKVIAAKAVSGHPLLQEAAVEAALQARFSPTLREGFPVKVSSVINYNFVLR